MAVRRTHNPSQSANPSLTALLDLSGLLTRSTPGGVFSEALACVLAGTGLHAGVVHEMTPSGLELAAEEGLPAALRAQIGALSTTESPWFVVQNAIKRRRLIVEEDAVSLFGSRVSESVRRAARWNAVAAAPIMFGRDAFGAISLAAPSGELFTQPRLEMLETVANMLALHLAQVKTAAEEAAVPEGPGSLTEVDEKLTRLATYGALAQGFADDLRAVSSQLSTFLKQQEKWLEQLRRKHPGAAPVIRELEPLQEEAASALMLVRSSGGRLLAALDENAMEVLDVSSVVQDVVGHAEPVARSRSVDVIVALQPNSEPLVRGRKSEIRQMISGLVSDGIEACGREDKLDGLAIPAPQMQIVSVTLTREKTKLVLVVEHSGKGASTEHRQTARVRPSRPKEALGLLLARNIVAAHAGTLEVMRSELGGALVRVVLPAATPPPSSKRNKGGPASSKRARQNAATLDAFPATARDGWTAKPNALPGGQPLNIRAPAPKRISPEDSPNSEVDTLASTERGAALAASAMPPSPRGHQDVVITEGTDSGAPSIASPPTSRRRSQSGQPTKRRG